MNKIVAIIEEIMRIIMFIVAIAMLASALSLASLHLANKNQAKTPVSAQIVAHNGLFKEVEYTFENQSFRERPLDSYFRSLGRANQAITVYVENAHPTRVFTTRNAEDLIRSAGFMGGWSLFLFVILIGEHQLLGRMKRIEKIEEQEN